MPTINLGRVGFVQKGIHSLLTPYKVNDVVTSDGQVYACILANTGEALSNDVYWSPWVTPAGIISDDTPLTTKAYSGTKTQLLHDIQAEAISNLATASGRIGSESSPVFSPIPLVLTDMPFQVLTDSTDTNVIEFDAVANTITLKINASFNFLSNVTFTSATSAERTITFALIDTSDDSVVTTEVGTFDFSSGVTTVVPFNTLLTLGKNGMPSAPLTIKVQALASGTGYTLNNFSSILASSSAYDSATTDASTVIVTPSGSISSTNAQAALQELDTEKANADAVVALTGDQTKAGVLTFTSSPLVPKATKGDNTTKTASTSYVFEGLADKLNTVDLATTAEVQAGTSTTKVVTPLRLREGLNATGTAPIYACRAWANFNGTNTVAIRASGNVSSITDNGVGDYTVNFTTAMPDVNYSPVAQIDRISDGYFSVIYTNSSRSISTTSISFLTKNNVAIAEDTIQNTIAIFR